MSETFYRFHQSSAPEFSADNAWSALWGSEFSADGKQNRCHGCWGNGLDADNTGPCRDCDGDGWEDCLRGYSCCWSAAELAGYFGTERGGAPADHHGTVIAFEGCRVGSGFDGEPLVIPERIVKTMTWSEFIAAGDAG